MRNEETNKVTSFAITENSIWGNETLYWYHKKIISTLCALIKSVINIGGDAWFSGEIETVQMNFAREIFCLQVWISVFDIIIEIYAIWIGNEITYFD